MDKAETGEIVLKGINASPGICIGKAYLVDREGVDVIEKYHIPDKKIIHEIKRFKTAVKIAKDELRVIIEKSPEELKELLLQSKDNPDDCLMCGS